MSLNVDEFPVWHHESAYLPGDLLQATVSRIMGMVYPTLRFRGGRRLAEHATARWKKIDMQLGV